MKIDDLMYHILKAIDESFENQNYNFDTTFNLTELGVSKHKLESIFKDLIGSHYIDIDDENTPFVTIRGFKFMEGYK